MEHRHDEHWTGEDVCSEREREKGRRLVGGTGQDAPEFCVQCLRAIHGDGKRAGGSAADAGRSTLQCFRLGLP